mgnify:CR=1 FL=1
MKQNTVRRGKRKAISMYRHGDVLLRRVASVPDGATPMAHCTLATGEATGHSHTIPHGAVQYLHDTQQYVHVTGESADLVHQEHSTIRLQGPAVYLVVHQREYSPVANRAVMD